MLKTDNNNNKHLQYALYKNILKLIFSVLQAEISWGKNKM